MEARFETFTVLISKISRNIKRIKNMEMAEYGLRSIHVSCIYYLYSAEALTSKELCDRCEEDKATISRSLEYLEENGFITINSGSTKRYRCPIRLTEKGLVAGKRIAEKISFVLNEFCVGLSEAERLEFYRCLNIINDSLEQCVNNIK